MVIIHLSAAVKEWLLEICTSSYAFGKSENGKNLEGGDIGTNERSLVLFNLSHKVNGP